MTNSLAAALLLKPEISTNIANLFEDNFSAFSSYLARRGMTKKGLYPGLSEPNFKVIGNRKFMWALKGYPFRKGIIVQAPFSATHPNEIGLNGSVFTIYLDTNYFSPYDVLELKDRRTNVQIMDNYPTEVSTGLWSYEAKLVTNVPGAFITAASTLLDVGSEVGFNHTAFYEMSETGYEKNTYPEWHTNYMTIQRMQYSISGSANESVLWVEHNGQKLWVKTQDMEMMRRWSYARENQLLYGKATIDANEHVYLRDLKGREIIQGDGIIAQGDSSLKFQYNKLNVKVIENVMRDMQLLATNDGTTELFVMGGQAFVWDFSTLMRDVFKFNPMPLFVTEEQQKQGVKANFVSYEGPGVRLVVAWNKGFDAAWRPQSTDIFGTSKESRRAIFASLGNTIGGDPMIELVALGKRAFVKKTIDGMASPGGNNKEFASNSMDGYQVQVLSETGIKLGNPFGVAELYVP
jgi:hypothetical protein